MLQEWVDEYVADRVGVGDFVESSAKVIRSTLLRFSRHVAGVEPELVTKTHVEAWLRPHLDEPATVKSMITKLRPFVRWLVAREWITRDFTVGVRTPPIVKGPVRCLASEKVSLVLRQCPDERATLTVLLMVCMGLRAGEVARIRIADVDVDRLELGVRGKGGRGRITRRLPVHDDVWRLMRRYHATKAFAGSTLIASYRRPNEGLSPHWVSKMTARWIHDAGVDETAHALRHTFAQEMLDSGEDWRLVQDALGHASIATTIDLYGRKRPTGLRTAMNARHYAA